MCIKFGHITGAKPLCIKINVRAFSLQDRFAQNQEV